MSNMQSADEEWEEKFLKEQIELVRGRTTRINSDQNIGPVITSPRAYYKNYAHGSKCQVSCSGLESDRHENVDPVVFGIQQSNLV